MYIFNLVDLTKLPYFISKLLYYFQVFVIIKVFFMRPNKLKNNMTELSLNYHFFRLMLS